MRPAGTTRLALPAAATGRRHAGLRSPRSRPEPAESVTTGVVSEE